jgi:hypothetical protein
MTTRPELKAPFPWFGGKRRVAPVVWAAFGDPAANETRPLWPEDGGGQ